ncbi:hypothetical protein Mboo_0211 [Methanoregula boonei 6A8]|uniref:Uncharacterized protein n=1 Tax=Methanoregula boonei (strain DSM 21154 / JCM 14090 / 6A8) TaxID=456442 RepID=A7I4S2_METB6|nr:hypothetical protein [Methanoregula boonei]ABS54733.1 hypothetical protein Mboo_0211 [Methanoregula boonei 6A8]
MTTVRKIVLASAVLICAALVMVPLVSAAGPGQGFSPGGQQNQGQGNQIAPGNGGNGNNPGSGNDQNSGNGAMASGGPGNGQNRQTPGAGIQPFAGNMTAPQGQPDQNFGNASWNATPPGPGGALNLTAVGNALFGQLPPDANATGSNNWTNNWTMQLNATGLKPDGQNVPLPAGNLTGHNPADGNVTPPSQPALSGNGNTNNAGNQNNAGTATQGYSSGPQAGSTSQSASQDQKDSNLIEAFLTWLRGGGSSTT